MPEKDKFSAKQRGIFKLKFLAKEILLFILTGIIAFLVSSKYDILERFLRFSQKHESWELDEWLIVALVWVVLLLVFLVRMNQKLKKQKEQLQKAWKEVAELREVIPICAYCKKIRTDKGYWERVEEYFSKHTHAKFTHGVCPTCKEKLLEEIKEIKKEIQKEKAL